MIGLLRLENKKFDHGNHGFLSLMKHFCAFHFGKANKRFVIYR